MYNTAADRISCAIKYINLLKWTLTFVHGDGERAKVPLFQGWPDLRPTPEIVEEVLGFNHDAGIGINLGASGLVDLEGDSPEAEATLDDLCKGLEFPCWRSRKSKHRLFVRPPDLLHLRSEESEIEFRTGRHQSVLPPSIINGTAYKWLLTPFEVKPPPLPDHIRRFYKELLTRPGVRVERQQSKASPRWPYRDHRDYVLRKFDLKEEAAKAGLKFMCGRPDAIGNIPCHVPAQLRGGNEDHRASGVFNVLSGVLRDFATGQNHLFFNVLAALSGQPWQEISEEFEAQADAVKGRPHSRRLSYPNDSLADARRQPLEEVRATLGAYYQEQLSRPPCPRTIHVIKGPPGLGKTYTLCMAIAQAQKKAIILTLENKLARTHESLLLDGGGSPRRMPVLRESGCPTPDQYDATSRRGFKPSQSLPCGKCPIGVNHCDYLLGFSALDQADQLCAAAIYHTHDDFYQSHGNEDRPYLVFDENCLDLILAPVSNSIQQWRSFAAMLASFDEGEMSPENAPIHRLVEWFNEIEKNFSYAVNKDGEPTKFQIVPLPDDLRVAEFTKNERIEKWLNRSAHTRANREVMNLYGAACYLLREPTSYVLLERMRVGKKEVIVNVRFRKKTPLPEDKEIFLLDATADVDLIRAIAPGWNIKVWECPPIEQKGRVVQIMDYDISRNRIKNEVANHKDTNPSWLIQLLDRILENYGPASLISFKSVTDDPEPEMDLLGKLRRRSAISSKHNFPCRGHTFEDKTLVVVGTPYKDEASIWEMAMAIGGPDCLPTTKYTRRQRTNGWFVSRNMEYADSHLKPIHDFIVSADLVQAIGRVRPLQNDSTVFVISNAPISDWQVEQFTASEIFDLRTPLRKDAASTYSRYVEKAHQLMDEGRAISNSLICKELGLAVRTGQGYWKKFGEENGDRVKQASSGLLSQNDDTLEGVVIFD